MSFSSPPVGWPVQFFPTGDLNHPHAATVTESGVGGQVKLNYQSIGGGDFKSGGKFIRHRNDPFVRENQALIQKVGCWDYIPGMVYQVEAKRTKETAKA